MTVENNKPEEQVEDVTVETAAQEAVAEEQQAEQVEEAVVDALEGTVETGDDLAQQLEAMTEEMAKVKDQALRAVAEAQNIKRRAEQDVEKAHKFALEKFVDALVPVVDSLEKGIESAEQAEGAHEALVEGMNLTLKQFLDALGRFKVEQENPEGQPFDPNFHQAMSMIPNPDVEPNTVLNVFQKGYKLNGRLVRPAMVVVSK
ncbi:nucleotide exchange factor GrpE [Endozoicomonas sp. OPT23]|uniref:nucleotide exchange factor GrpE n=1 Tax=Endozoicomonas sp. OPT23 TaxID=2072845 RepID=UPI00129A284A|nr:nucleotide exchange factor GrpE [Endozoicomonas sp. OPT23]MRI31778.1 nucleotide exchange factor GrpE [Endozoicomonas sp. OPT23]